MTFDNNNREKKLRKFYEATGSKAGLWIDNATGRIVDCLPIGARFRPGSGRICFQLADIELRPTRLTIATSLRRKIQESPRPVDLVGSVRIDTRLPRMRELPCFKSLVVGSSSESEVGHDDRQIPSPVVPHAAAGAAAVRDNLEPTRPSSLLARLCIGLRVGEIVLLDRDDIDLERGRIRIRRLKGGLSGERPIFRNLARTFRA
jgi:integrase